MHSNTEHFFTKKDLKYPQLFELIKKIYIFLDSYFNIVSLKKSQPYEGDSLAKQMKIMKNFLMT